MFKKHPGKKATESAESQSNSVQTAGKTDEAEGDFAGLLLCYCSQHGKQTDDVPQSLTYEPLPCSSGSFLCILLIHHMN